MIGRAIAAAAATAALAGCGSSSGGDAPAAPPSSVTSATPTATTQTKAASDGSQLPTIAIGGGQLPGFTPRKLNGTTDLAVWAKLTHQKVAYLKKAGWVAGGTVKLRPAAVAQAAEFKTVPQAQKYVLHFIGLPSVTRTAPAGSIGGALYAESADGNFIVFAKGVRAYSIGGPGKTLNQLLRAAEQQFRAAP